MISWQYSHQTYLVFSWKNKNWITTERVAQFSGYGKIQGNKIILYPIRHLNGWKLRPMNGWQKSSKGLGYRYTAVIMKDIQNFIKHHYCQWPFWDQKNQILLILFSSKFNSHLSAQNFQFLAHFRSTEFWNFFRYQGAGYGEDAFCTLWQLIAKRKGDC